MRCHSARADASSVRVTFSQSMSSTRCGGGRCRSGSGARGAEDLAWTAGGGVVGRVVALSRGGAPQLATMSAVPAPAMNLQYPVTSMRLPFEYSAPIPRPGDGHEHVLASCDCIGWNDGPCGGTAQGGSESS